MTRMLSLVVVALTCFALAPSHPAGAEADGYRYSIDFTTANTDSWKTYLGDLAGTPDARGL